MDHAHGPESGVLAVVRAGPVSEAGRVQRDEPPGHTVGAGTAEQRLDCDAAGQLPPGAVDPDDAAWALYGGVKPQVLIEIFV